VASSNDTKRIQTNNLVSTPQPMTATLIFRRQLVRPKSDLLTASSTADKLPLEKFHRLLDLVFWGKFLKLHTIPYFIFFTFCTGYHSTRLFYAGPAALLKRGRGDVPRLAVPPAHDYRSLNSGNDLLSTTVYSVLQRLTRDFGRTNTVSISGCITG
jgi:hypothetical protein